MDEKIKNPRIIMATDRKDLDRQIEKVFRQCGIEPEHAATGRELMDLIRSKTPVVTTSVHKFDKALNAGNMRDDDPDVFVLVDESHRTPVRDACGKDATDAAKGLRPWVYGTPADK